MFCNSKIAKEFSCGKTKCSYLAKDGIAPYLLEVLHGDIKNASRFVTMFDEFYNHATNKSQMNLHVRFWNGAENEVCSRYYASEFLGNASAKDILSSFIKCIFKTREPGLPGINK